MGRTSVQASHTSQQHGSQQHGSQQHGSQQHGIQQQQSAEAMEQLLQHVVVLSTRIGDASVVATSPEVASPAPVQTVEHFRIDDDTADISAIDDVVEEDEPLERYVYRDLRGSRGHKTVEYYVDSKIKPPGCTESNEATTLAKANARSRRWLKAMRAAGLWTSKDERSKTGRPTGVKPRSGGKWAAEPAKKSKTVVLRAPDGGNLFDTMEAAGAAIEAWKAAGRPYRGPLVFKNAYTGLYARK